MGAGIVGCAVGYELARRGASVQIVDDRQPGMGATQASAGMLAPFTEAKDRNTTFLELAVRSLDLYDEFVPRVADTARTTVGYKRTGTLDVASSRERLDHLRDVAARLEARGVKLSMLDAAEARAEEPQLGRSTLGALLIEAHGYVRAGELTRALVAAARCHGAQLVEGARARSISQRDGDLVVDTGRGSVTGGAVVVTAGSWSGEINVGAGTPRVPVRPVRGQLLHLAWQSDPLRRVTWGDHCYLVPWDNGTVLLGATMEEVGFDERTTVTGISGLMTAACDLIPSAGKAALGSARAGLRPGTPDALPIIGWSQAMPNLMYATGHFRNGVLLCPLTAQLVARAMVDGVDDPLLAEIGPRRFGAL
ncbi:MAG TPA: glycine oxidase ThiO [Vicinamibacterales bacterium]|nr:glycine oxidase ThiO [Vicinamibacterales bacterium]